MFVFVIMLALHGYCSAPREPSKATLIAQMWLQKRSNESISCQTPLQNMCVSLISNPDLRTVACQIVNATIISEKIDTQFALQITKLLGGYSLIQFGAGHGCYSYYFATSMAFLSFYAVDSDLSLSNSSHGVIEYLPYGSGALYDRKADVVLSLSRRCVPLSNTDCLNFGGIVKTSLKTVIVSSDTNLSFDNVNRTIIDKLNSDIKAAIESFGFYQDNDLTRKLRNAAATPAFKHTVAAFHRRHVLAYRVNTDFLAKNVPEIPWNNGIAFANRWYRLYLPETIRWDRYRIVIGLLTSRSTGDMRQAIRQTWGAHAKALGCLLVFIIADPDTQILAESQMHGDMMLIEARDVYTAENSTLPLKTFSIIQVVARYAKTMEWLFKCDDDTLLWTDRLLGLLGTLPNATTKHYYVGHAYYKALPVRDKNNWKWYTPNDLYPASYYPVYLAGGAGYALSASLVRCLALHSGGHNFMYFPREDVSVRLTIDAFCLPTTLVDKGRVFRPGTPQFPTPPDLISQHYVKGTKAMVEMWFPKS